MSAWELKCAENANGFILVLNVLSLISSSIWLKASLTTELTPAGKPEHYALISIQNGKGKNNLSIKMGWQQENTERQDLFPTHRVTARLKYSSKKMEASAA